MDLAEALYGKVVSLLRFSGLWVETDKFGAMMQVAIANPKRRFR
ncbi:hypothetical protein [Leptothermofonsia sp. ETS-13]